MVPKIYRDLSALGAHQEIDGTVYLKGRVLTNDHKDYFQFGKKFIAL